MQLKKNPRESQYPDPRAEYQEEPGMDEQTDSNPAPDPQSVTRAPRRPEFEGAAAAPRPAAADQRAASVVDAHSSFDGRYETDQDLRIEGRISGEIVCRGLLTIERDATARAKIQAHDAEIRGRIEGDIVCTGRLLLTSTAFVTGTMVAGALMVEEGATLSGKIETAAAASAGRAAEMPAAPAATPASDAPAATVSRVSQMNAERGSDASAPAAMPARATRREVPSFALVSSDDRKSVDRN
ncbi:MAG: polymer-forming cytoskeletal protein [Tepidiformaceae bacterium]